MKKIKVFGIVFVLLSSSINVFAQTVKDSVSTDKIDTLSMEKMVYELPDVLIKGEHPLAVVHGSAITYDMPRLIEKKAVDNVYDAIKEIPGIVESGGKYQLAGRSVSISLNGKVMSLNEEQLTSLLKSLPASRLKNAEVMYSAPAKTQIRGALINIQLNNKTSKEGALDGETSVTYNKEHYAMFGERASVLYHKGKFSLDAFYTYGHGKAFNERGERSVHTFNNGNVYDIDVNQTSVSKTRKHNYRLGANYDFAENHSLSLTYQGNYSNRDSYIDHYGNIVGSTITKDKTWLHNLRMDYKTPFGMEAGVEMTYYSNPENQNLVSSLPTGNTLKLDVDNNQKVNVWRYYLSMENELKNNWSINYGAWLKQSINHSSQNYINTSYGYSYLRQKEEIGNIYAGVGKNWNNKLILDASIAAEYYHSPMWNKWNVYPTFTLTYVPKPGNTWVLSFSNDKDYPEYWAMNNFTEYSNGGYDKIAGNPNLKPATSYQAQLVWILKNKYQFVTWFNHTDKYFIQLPYQQPDNLSILFRSINFNYQQQAGFQAVVPHKFGSWLDSKLTFTGVWTHEKCDDYYDIPFDRAIFLVIAKMSNVISISNTHNISFVVDGKIHSKAIQGVYDLPAAGNLNLGLRWQFWKKQATLHLFCNDIFETSSMSPHVDYKGQKLDMDFSCYRQFGMSLTYRFGDYKEKKRQEVDTSRFRK